MALQITSQPSWRNQIPLAEDLARDSRRTYISDRGPRTTSPRRFQYVGERRLDAYLQTSIPSLIESLGLSEQYHKASREEIACGFVECYYTYMSLDPRKLHVSIHETQAGKVEYHVTWLTSVTALLPIFRACRTKCGYFMVILELSID
jgi:hypothetical protein